MIHNIINSKEYRDITTKQIKELLSFLATNNEEFGLTANLNGITFTPDIPQTIKKHFTKYTLFSLANYTLESLELHDSYITFEAGFGEENFGSVCRIPYYAIFQVSIDNSILYINPTATVEKYFMSEEEELTQLERSRSAFKLNR
ncbi:MAG: hypothetical protein PHF17_03695 [Arcobacteraceae bacterium]|jgi:hypothetical protein|nr:hypothetical protein [Arcobacteraceae bacterium]